MNCPVSLETAQVVTENVLQRGDLGTEGWWQSISILGTPLRRQLSCTQLELTFLWRDPQGFPSDTYQVYIDVYSHTPHPVQQLTTLRRWGQSDLWFWQTCVPVDWVGSYFLIPIASNQLPPVEATPPVLRRWWIGLMNTCAQADGFNLLPTHGNGWGLPLSAIEPPASPERLLWHGSKSFCGHQVQTIWNSRILGNERCVWTYHSGEAEASSELPLVLLLDGHYWCRQMPIFSPIDALTAAGHLPPAFYVLIDAISPTDRARDMPCNNLFWTAVQEELLPQLRKQAAFTAKPERTLVVGQSFGGLAALYAALHWPQRFGLVFSQSGSFWWPDAAETGAEGWLTQAVYAGLGSGARLRVQLDVGCYETDMTGPNQAMAEALRAANHEVTYREIRGGHDWLCWRNAFFQGIGQLLNGLQLATP